MLVVCAGVSTSSAATPSWYPQLQLAVLDAGDAGAAIGACVAPRAAETGAEVGPCKRLSRELDHTTTAAAARAPAFAKHSTTTMAKDVSGRRALELAAKHVTADFAALQHCLGTS